MVLFSVASILSAAQLIVREQPCIPKIFPDGLACVCSTKCDISSAVTPALPNGYYFQIETSKDGDRLKRNVKPFNITKRSASRVVKIDLTQRRQKILGWGGTFSDATGLNINSLGVKQRQNLLKSYFSADGLQLSLCRVPIGDSDFSKTAYTLDSISDDVNLTYFNLTAQDYIDKIPLIKEANKLSENTLKLFASASNAPSWMLNGKHMADQFYATWANYHVKFMDEYKKKGINFWGLSTGYEPNFSQSNRLKWTPTALNTWVTKNLGPSLRGANYSNVKLISYDDVRSRITWTTKGLFSPQFKTFVQGIAVHSALNEFLESTLFNEIKTTYPDYFYLSTEFKADKRKPIKIGSWEVAEEYAKKIIEDLNNMIVGHVDFNLALNTEGGPTYINRYADAPIIVNATGNEFYKQPLYYIIGHFSKYIPPGSVQLGTTSNVRRMYVSAFERPDKGIVLIILNRSYRNIQLDVLVQGNPNITCYVKKRSINSIIYWKK